MKTLTIRFDGSVRGNGTAEAHGGYGWHADLAGVPVAEGYGPVPPPMTNNVSEWHGLRAALAWATVNAKGYELLIIGDSQLVVNTLRGDWKSKKPHLTRLRDDCRRLLRGFRWAVKWQRRWANEVSDGLAFRGVGHPRHEVAFLNPFAVLPAGSEP